MLEAFLGGLGLLLFWAFATGYTLQTLLEEETENHPRKK
jgi:hypothetical protein